MIVWCFGLINSRVAIEFIIREISAFCVWAKSTEILLVYVVENIQNVIIFALDTTN